MADDKLDLDRVDHEIRINELKEQARELTGGQMEAFESDDLDDPKLRAIREAFWENVVKVEAGGWITAWQQLQTAGVELPPPEKLTDKQLTAKLQEVIVRLSKLRTYLLNTNHLSDRELYEALWREVLDESVPAAMVDDSAGAYIIDLVGSGSEEHIELYLRYYADEQSRQRWQKDFPDYAMPPHEEPPYDRDQQLPQSPIEHGPPQRAGRAGSSLRLLPGTLPYPSGVVRSSCRRRRRSPSASAGEKQKLCGARSRNGAKTFWPRGPMKIFRSWPLWAVLCRVGR